MATAGFAATAGTVEATAETSGAVEASVSAAAAVVTDLTTAFTAADVFGNAVVAITGDTYSDTTHKFTTGGATGLNHAQWVTLAGEYNTAIGDFVTAQTAANTANTAAGGISSDLFVYIGSIANVASMDVLEQCWRRIKRVIAGTGLLAQGSPTPRDP